MKHPSELTVDEVVTYFLQFARQLLRPPVSATTVLGELVDFYRECRVSGAPLEEGYDADTLCIECGNYSKITAIAIDDFRGQGDAGYKSGPEELQLSISRTVHAIDALADDSEFDDDGFEMNITLYFGPTDDDASYCLQVSTLEELAPEISRLTRDPLVSRLLTETPSDTSAHVGGAG